jgi:hypothetical protein
MSVFDRRFTAPAESPLRVLLAFLPEFSRALLMACRLPLLETLTFSAALKRERR